MSREKELHLLNKVINTPIIKKVYPMVDNINVEVKEDSTGDEYLLFTINSNVDFNFHDMYKSGLDPHYLIEYSIFKLYKGILPDFKKIPYNNNTYNVIVKDPNGKVIYDFFREINKRGYTR